MDPILVITNRDAGTAHDDTLESALTLLREHTSVEVAATADPGELDGVLHRAGSSRIVVVAGGDGSMHAVVGALHRRGELAGRSLALLPMGTGNDFARGNELPLDVLEAARLVVEGTAREVDLLVNDAGGIVVNNVHIGAGAQASRRGARWKDRLGSIGIGKLNLGKLGYPIGTVQAALVPPSIKVTVEIDGEVVNDLTQPVLMVALGNGSHVGGGTELNPEADPEDGRVDVVISRSVDPWAKLSYVWSLRKGEHHERDDVLNLTGKKVTISGESFYGSADGEIFGPERERTWRVQRAAYRLFLPSE